MNSWHLRRIDAGGSAAPFHLKERMHLLGSGQACDLRIDGLPIELLQFWRDGESYRMVRMGPVGSVKCNAVDADERVLQEGDVIACGSIALRFEASNSPSYPDASTTAPSAPPPAYVPQPAFAPAPAPGTHVAQLPTAPLLGSAEGTPRWVALAAAAWVASEGKLAKATQQQWEKVLREGGAWNVEACAADVLAAATLDDTRPQAAIHALRDALAKRLIRSSQRGAARKRFVARLIVQLFVFLVLGGALFAGALVLRSTMGVDFNAAFDFVLKAVNDLSGGGI